MGYEGWEKTDMDPIDAQIKMALADHVGQMAAFKVDELPPMPETGDRFAFINIEMMPRNPDEEPNILLRFITNAEGARLLGSAILQVVDHMNKGDG